MTKSRGERGESQERKRAEKASKVLEALKRMEALALRGYVRARTHNTEVGKSKHLKGTERYL